MIGQKVAVDPALRGADKRLHHGRYPALGLDDIEFEIAGVRGRIDIGHQPVDDLAGIFEHLDAVIVCHMETGIGADALAHGAECI